MFVGIFLCIGWYGLQGGGILWPKLNLTKHGTRAQGERNFHILYELVAGAAKGGLAKELQVRRQIAAQYPCRSRHVYGSGGRLIKATVARA